MEAPITLIWTAAALRTRRKAKNASLNTRSRKMKFRTFAAVAGRETIPTSNSLGALEAQTTFPLIWRKAAVGPVG